MRGNSTTWHQATEHGRIPTTATPATSQKDVAGGRCVADVADVAMEWKGGNNNGTGTLYGMLPVLPVLPRIAQEDSEPDYEEF